MGAGLVKNDQPQSTPSVPYRLGKLASLLGCVARHKHLAGLFGETGFTVCKIRTRRKAFVAGAKVAVFPQCKTVGVSKAAVILPARDAGRGTRGAVGKITVTKAIALRSRLTLERAAAVIAVVAKTTTRTTTRTTTEATRRFSDGVAATTAAKAANATVRTIAKTITTGTL